MVKNPLLSQYFLCGGWHLGDWGGCYPEIPMLRTYPRTPRDPDNDCQKCEGLALFPWVQLGPYGARGTWEMRPCGKTWISAIPKRYFGCLQPDIYHIFHLG